MSPHYKEIPPELRQILDSHEQWLETGGQQGKQAILSKYDFQGLQLFQAALEEAILEEADFQGACLANANLKRASLRGAKFSEADVNDADFRDANLEKADLAHSLGLTDGQLARANLDDCQLPEALKKFGGLDYVKEASGITSSLFTTMMLACGFACFTAFTTTDVALVTNTGTTSLPFLNVVTNMAFFYITGPFLLLAMYIYFHLNLQHLWEAIGTLPAVFPDGKRLDQKVYPWLFNWLPSLYFFQIKRLQGFRPAYWVLERGIAVFFAWFFVPLTLMILWFRYLYVRNFWVTYWHLALLTAAVWSGCHFYLSCKTTILGENSRQLKKFILNFLNTGLFLVLIYGFSDGFINGIPATLELELRPDVGGYFHRKFVPEILNYLPWHANIAANFEEADVSTNTDKDDAKDTDGNKKVMAKGAYLKGCDLRYLRAKGAFMAKADLRAANLELAYCRGADLRKAKLGEVGYPEDAAKLENATLFNANLTDACLFRANLFRASLVGANLQDANLEEAVLAEANLSYAILKNVKLGGAILRAANLQGADLTGAKGLEVSQLKEARAWMLAYYDDEIIKNLKLEATHNTQLEKQKKPPKGLDELDLRHTDLEKFDFTQASLTKSDLRGANLREANLQGANLQGANLSKANLMRAKCQKADLGKADLTDANLWLTDFVGARGLDEKQLKSGKNWSLARYDDDMIKRLNLPSDHNSRVLTNRLAQYDLKNADLKSKEKFLVGADFQGADLRRADLSFSELRQTNLQGADLSEANLTGAYLGKANLRDANLNGTILEKANLEGADLTGVRGLTSGQLKTAIVDRKTQLPK